VKEALHASGASRPRYGDTDPDHPECWHHRAIVLSGRWSNHQITTIFYQAGHTDIQKDINLDMRDWSFSADFLERRKQAWSLCVMTFAVSQAAGERAQDG